MTIEWLLCYDCKWQVVAVEWLYDESPDLKGKQRALSPGKQLNSIASYIAEHKFDLIINLPLRSGAGKSIGASTFMTQGYRTRRLAVDYSVPLFTDIKCAKLFIEVCLFSLDRAF